MTVRTINFDENIECGIRPSASPCGIKPARKSVCPPIIKDAADYKKLDLPPFLRNRKNCVANNIDSIEPPAVQSPRPNAETVVEASVSGVVKMSDLGHLSKFIAEMKMTPNSKLGCVDFSLPTEASVAFRRYPEKIAVGDKQPDEQIILAMLELARNDFGTIEVYGSPDFIEKAVSVAVKNGIVLQNREYVRAISQSNQPRMKG
jgi:hypothetical protein